MQNSINNNKFRQSNIELLRIIAMFLIIAHHYAIHSGFNFSTTAITINRLWVQFLQIGGKIGVNVFILIFGYFLIYSKTIKTTKILKLWGTVLFYSYTFLILFTIMGGY